MQLPMTSIKLCNRFSVLTTHRLVMTSRKTIKVAIALVVIGSAAAYLLYKAVQSSWAYYYPVDQLVETALAPGGESADRLVFTNRTIRLAGRVKPGSITPSDSAAGLDFELAGQRNSIRVTYHGPIPANFAADKELVVEGKLNSQGLFDAGKILTRCESKYKARKTE